MSVGSALEFRRETFDSAYFRKYYFNAATRVTTAAEMHGRAQLIAAILRHAHVPVRSILDAGCGMGLLRKPFEEALPRARYVGLEASDYLCARGTHGPRARWSISNRASSSDLVVCYDVLQYWAIAHAARAIANLARLTRAALYVSALTREDWRENCDRSRTDRRRAPAAGRMVSTPPAQAIPLPRLRRLAAQGRDRDTLGHGAAGRPLRIHKLSRIHATSAACTGSPAPIVRTQ